MDELREKVALVLAKWLGETGTVSPQFWPIADDILDLPEIKESLAERARQRAIDERNEWAKKAMRPSPLGHRISTNPPD